MACKHPPIPHSAGKNWIEEEGGLPEMMDCVARALFHERGKPKQRAYEMAVGVVEDWAAGKKGVTAKTQARAAKAVAQWEAMRARRKAKKAGK